MPRVGRSVRITGRVQGVFFRGWTVEQARELGVVGWVRNCPDGSVEAQLSGDEQAVAELIERMGRGPRDARVDQVQIDAILPDDDGTFRIRRD